MNSKFAYLILAILLFKILNKHIFIITNSISTTEGELIQPSKLTVLDS